MSRAPRDSVVRLYDEGVDAFQAAADGLSPVGWTRTACGSWSVLQLARHVLADGPAAVEQFVALARAYRARLPTAWNLPYGFPRGTVTAGLHAGVAGCEWHLHTWDLAHVRGFGHRPSDPSTLYAATGDCLAAAEGGLKGRVTGVLVPLGSRLRPWEAILRRSGRAPAADD